MWPALSESAGGQHVAKDKKKKKNDKGVGGGTMKTLKALGQNRLVADVVAAALVATASALKDSKKAQRLASDAGDELTKLSKAGAKRGGALWDMALQIGRESLEALSGELGAKPAKPKSRTSKAKPAAKKTATRKPAAQKVAAKKSSAKRTSAPKAARSRQGAKKSK
jgi:hypothetical protein